jgi:hypothetical protein
MRTILALVVMVAGSLLPGSIEVLAIASNPSLPSDTAAVTATRTARAAPCRWDIRRQELPKKVPAHVEKLTVPDLDPLIDQLIRHSELDSKAIKIMPWIYSTCEEVLVADYEDAVGSLDSASAHLQLAMRHLVEKSHQSVETDISIVLAKHDIDQAEYTILFLLELATHEL